MSSGQHRTNPGFNIYVNTNFIFEFLEAAKEGPGLYFAPLLRAINVFRDALHRVTNEQFDWVTKDSYIKEFEMKNDTHHREKICDAIFGAGAWLSEMSPNFELLRSWEAEGRIFSLEYKGIRYYAAYQFDSDGAPIPVIREVLLRLISKDPWSHAAWFHFPNSWINDGTGPTAPKNVVCNREKILEAANQSGETYVA